MARIPIFDSQATVGSADRAVEMAFVYNTPVASMPFRCFATKDIRNITYEFFLSGLGTGAWEFQWYQEYFMDEPWPQGHSRAPGMYGYPTERTFPGAGTSLPWAREQSQELAGAGAINHYNVTRTITLNEPSDSRHLPMQIQALWTRIAITPTTNDSPYPRLRVWVSVAGHPQELYLETLATPFQYNVGM